MAATPILDDFDFNYSEILKAKIENVNLLPTGLNTSHRGYAVYYNGKIYIWDGRKWNTWSDTAYWSYEISNNLDPATPRDETTLFNITAHFIEFPDTNYDISIGYTDNLQRTIGTLEFIGRDTALSDWTTMDGRRIVVSGNNGCWFNIKNNSTNTPPSDHKKILTRHTKDIDRIVKAEFIYNSTNNAWILISYEKKTDLWFARFDIPDSTLVTTNPITGYIPNSGTIGLPYNGFYEVDVFVSVAEYEANGITRVNVMAPQQLEIRARGDSWRIIDVSGTFGAVGPIPEGVWLNNSLQGSAIVYVDSNICIDRKFQYRVTLPNGTYRRVFGGYLHARYLGTQEGFYCV